jgi:hypothetical protein
MMDSKSVKQIDPRRLEAEIQEFYDAQLVDGALANRLGWRLLYSPERVLEGARVAFLGFNPGGSHIDPRHGVFATPRGSAYRRDIESWGTASKLQDQALALFRRLRVKPEDVLAGNLVPLRSPSEAELRNKERAIGFGIKIWTQILAAVNPPIVISLGNSTNEIVSRLVGARDVRKVEVGWGTITASRGEFDGGIWIGLPHLSRFAIMTRRESAKALDLLFAGTAQ